MSDGELVHRGEVLSGETVDRPTVDVTGLRGVGLTVGPDEVLVIVISQYVDPRQLMLHREVIEHAIPRDRYLILQGMQVAKVSLARAAEWRELLAGSGQG